MSGRLPVTVSPRVLGAIVGVTSPADPATMYHLCTTAGVLWIEPSKTPPERWVLCFAPSDGSSPKSWPYKSINSAATAVYERRTGFAAWDGHPRAADEPKGISGWSKGSPPDRKS